MNASVITIFQTDKNSKPPKLTLPNLRLTSTEAWCLLRNLPLVIGSLVPR